MSGGIERMTCTEEDDEDTHRSDMEVASVFLEVFVMCFLNDVLQNTFILITKGFFFGSGKIFGHTEYLGK